MTTLRSSKILTLRLPIAHSEYRPWCSRWHGSDRGARHSVNERSLTDSAKMRIGQIEATSVLSPPHRPHARRKIDPRAVGRRARGRGLGLGPGRAVEMLEQRGRDEAGAARVDAAVAVPRLSVDIEALRDDEREFVLRAGHRDIEEAPLLLDLLRRAGGEVGGNAAVDAVQDEHRAPFLPLGRMDGREDEIVLVAVGRPRFVAGR